jgi:hypothetical protein
MECA